MLYSTGRRHNQPVWRFSVNRFWELIYYERPLAVLRDFGALHVAEVARLRDVDLELRQRPPKSGDFGYPWIQTMRVFLLTVGASILPLIWGWAVHRLLGWLWPEPEDGSAALGEPPGPGPAPTPFEYQI